MIIFYQTHRLINAFTSVQIFEVVQTRTDVVLDLVIHRHPSLVFAAVWNAGDQFGMRSRNDFGDHQQKRRLQKLIALIGQVQLLILLDELLQLQVTAVHPGVDQIDRVAFDRCDRFAFAFAGGRIVKVVFEII